MLLRHETYEHSYPHCWRCRNPLIYRAVSSWFIKVTEFRDRMVELNQEITWYPEHVKDGQFGKWLQGARDWSISRNRYWGTPIPVWKSDDPAYPRVDVYGSLDELERDFGVRPTDLHRPYIDELTRPNPDDPTGSSTMRRIEDVLDVWFDSGSMPYAQVHYPFENQDWFDSHFPGDFIVEYIGQTRGWFYTLHILATALFDKPAFKTCVAHGIVLGNDGQKMSKSLRNYPDVTEVFDRDGSDAMRWFLMASPILRGGNLIVTEQGIREGVRQVLLPLWNAYTFLALYAPKKGTWRTDSAHVLDRYILAKLAELRDDLTESLDVCDISGACDELRQFTEALTNWYVRRSRSRFWEEDPDAIDTLHTVLEVTGRLAAPLLPLITEVIWRGVTGERSVHLTDWPEADVLPKDPELVADMDLVREVASAASSLRKAKKLRVRLPLPKLTVAVDDPQRLERVQGLDRRRAERQGGRAHRRHRHLRPLRADRQRQGRRTAVGQGRAGRDQGRQGRRGGHQRRRNVDGGTGGVAARGVQLPVGGRRSRVHRRAVGRRGAGGARRHRDPGAGGRGLGQGPHSRTAGPAQVDRPRRVRPDLCRHLGAGRAARTGREPTAT